MIMSNPLPIVVEGIIGFGHFLLGLTLRKNHSSRIGKYMLEFLDC